VRASFAPLPLPGRPEPRPVLDVVLDGRDDVPLLCLIDTGSLRTRLPGWMSELLGLDLAGVPEERVVVGGVPVLSRHAHVRVRIGQHEVPAGVWFCDGWNAAFGLLGQEDVLRAFRLELSSAEGWFELRPERA
jgi:hypothetical protein